METAWKLKLGILGYFQQFLPVFGNWNGTKLCSRTSKFYFSTNISSRLVQSSSLELIDKWNLLRKLLDQVCIQNFRIIVVFQVVSSKAVGIIEFSIMSWMISKVLTFTISEANSLVAFVLDPQGSRLSEETMNFPSCIVVSYQACNSLENKTRYFFSKKNFSAIQHFRNLKSFFKVHAKIANLNLLNIFIELHLCFIPRFFREICRPFFGFQKLFLKLDCFI